MVAHTLALPYLNTLPYPKPFHTHNLPYPVLTNILPDPIHISMHIYLNPYGLML